MKNLAVLLLILFTASTAYSAPSQGGFSYEGRLYGTNGAPSTANVQIILSVYDPSATCLLHAEQTAMIDLSQTDGYFSVTVGQGTLLGSDPGLSLLAVFSNQSMITGASSCHYTPVNGDRRILRVAIYDGATTTAMTPDIAIGTAPYATVADSLQGKLPAAFLQANPTTAAVTQANIESVFSTSANVTELQHLVAGTSTNYLKASSTSGTIVPTLGATPSSPVAGQFWFDTSSNSLKYYDGSATQTVGASSATGTVTSITFGTGLTGGTITNNGTVGLATVGTPGTFIKVTTDPFGRVVSGAALSASDIPSLNWSKISTGQPTTLSGYGITDAVANAGGVQSIQSGTDAAKPAAATAGRLYVATDTHQIYRDNGTTWDSFSGVAGITGLNGDLSASGSGMVAATVTAVGGSSASNIHAAESLANGASSASVASSLVKRDASAGFSANSITANALLFKDSGANTISLAAPTTVSSNYSLRLPASVGTTNQVLQTDGSGNLSWASPTNGTVTSIGLSMPSIFNVSNSPLNSTGAISVSLNTQSAHQIFSGPISGSAAPAFRALNISDIQSSITGSFLSGSTCSGGQALQYNSITDTISCQTLSINLSTGVAGVLSTANGGTGTTDGSVHATSGAFSSNVGIGTTAPTSPLQIVNSSGNPGISVTSAGSSVGVYASSASYYGVYGSSGSNAAVYGSSCTTGANCFGVSGLGNFGVVGKASSPSLGTAGVAGWGPDSTTYGYVGAAVSGINYSFVGNGTIATTSNVGIGTTSPLTALEVAGSSATPSIGPNILLMRSHSGTTAQVNDVLGTLSFGGIDSVNSPVLSAFITATAAGTISSGSVPTDLRFQTGNGASSAERMRISATGNVGIGTTAPSAFLDVENSSLTSPMLIVGNSNMSATAPSARIIASSSSAVALLVSNSSGPALEVGTSSDDPIREMTSYMGVSFGLTSSSVTAWQGASGTWTPSGQLGTMTGQDVLICTPTPYPSSTNITWSCGYDGSTVRLTVICAQGTACTGLNTISWRVSVIRWI